MTPQERQMVAELFDRLASLEGERRDPDAERVIRDGLGHSPNAVYALVQTVLVQDEALKRANARIEELEHAAGGGGPAQGGGFLDSMRNVLTGQSRGSVPPVRQGGQGSSGAWGAPPSGNAPPPGYQQQPGYPPQPGYMQGAPMGGGMMGGQGGSFLGTAAATVAGVVGGAMLLNGIRGMMGGGHQSFGGDLDRGSSGGSHAASPWDSGGGGGGSGDLSRDAGLGDIGGGGHRAASYDDSGRSGFLGGNDDQPVEQPADDSFDTGDAGGFDGGGDSDNA